MARKEKKYHYIYKTTNVVTGKYYFGMHSTDDLNDGYFGSGRRLRHSIRKYGKENHNVEILEHVENREKLIKREKEIVNPNEIAKKDCMNLIIGGGAIPNGLPNEVISRIRQGASNFLKNKWKDKNYRKKISTLASERLKERHKRGKVNQNTFEGRKHSEMTKKKMSEAKKGKGVGKQNSQFGTCWITKGGVNKKIDILELDSYIAENWIKGRKL